MKTDGFSQEITGSRTRGRSPKAGRVIFVRLECCKNAHKASIFATARIGVFLVFFVITRCCMNAAVFDIRREFVLLPGDSD